MWASRFRLHHIPSLINVDIRRVVITIRIMLPPTQMVTHHHTTWFLRTTWFCTLLGVYTPLARVLYETWTTFRMPWVVVPRLCTKSTVLHCEKKTFWTNSKSIKTRMTERGSTLLELEQPIPSSDPFMLARRVQRRPAQSSQPNIGPSSQGGLQ
jgi:hypothetical protein